MTPRRVPMHRLVAEGVQLGYGDRIVIPELTLEIPMGRISVVIGPNACGKSTLLRALARLLVPQRGAVLLDGRDIAKQPTRDVARIIGLLSQQSVAPPGITVAEIVARGRYPQQGFLARLSAADDAAVQQALVMTGTADLADRLVEELSGGQRQRVWIAMTLAQQTDILLLDEPTTFLDIAHQLEIVEIIQRLNRDLGTTVVMVLHELALAIRSADHLIAMRAGEIYTQGPPRSVVTAAMVKDVFGVEAQILTDPLTGDPIVVPVRRCVDEGDDS